jgi:hypothetical protein
MTLNKIKRRLADAKRYVVWRLTEALAMATLVLLTFLFAVIAGVSEMWYAIGQWTDDADR